MMKFLILALCVYAAQSASVRGSVGPKWQGQAHASVQVQPNLPPQPVSTVAKTNYDSDVDAPIIRSESEVNADSFSYTYETGNGISAQADGTLKKVDNLDVITVVGNYQYTAPDGTPVQVSYVADENGYQPQSDLLPVGPPVPPAIARSLEYIAAHPPPMESVKHF